MDGLTFPRPDEAFPAALQQSGMLVPKDGVLALGISVDAFAKRPLVAQIRPLIQGFVHNGDWQELEKQSWYEAGELYARGREALIFALRRLPSDVDGFFIIDDFSDLLFDTIGSEFSLHRRLFRPVFIWNRSPKEAAKEEEKWRQNRRQEWQELERPWISAVLETWLYYLGLVELGWAENSTAPTHFRLSELGRAMFLPESAIPGEATVRAPQHRLPSRSGAWVIQPNFDLLVYLDRASSEQLAFLERHAQHVEVQQHTAQYRLTRESVYHALENGSTLQEILSGLESGAAVEMSQNVATEIRHWAALREEIALHRRSRLLEFPAARSRQKALDGGIQGTPVGDRFLLLAPQQAENLSRQKKFDYARSLPKCLSVTEKGRITVTDPDVDFLVEPVLDRWAQRQPDGRWLLTEGSVQAAIEAKHPVDELFDFLKERLTHRRPLLLDIALQSWSGQRFRVDMEPVTVFHCPIPKVFQAIARSRTLKPYLRGQLALHLLVVETRKIEDLRAQLQWMGLEISDELIFSTEKPEMG
ncbi:MAG: helicase-associated domain-containing protein [Candidatus Poribacteria bacterium]|nr:helicase-associated domain-containing protein [Candidatus Poribacteria bacterium]